ncbi:hypothetical protein [Latilactobacillus sakei]|uniref:hypothetical protein n=1 Tax=Latilactobacillus sakei TaxID=1599 RepID=UPI001BD57FF7|nr:hypothetical protein [Latilactobacillus sakei]QVQ48520.1 hypothetical protein KIK01_07870 [Latilactobacillus sakei subsp. sakei]
MTDLYIATPTRADYDALMRLAEAAGYKWCSGSKPTEEHKFVRYECETVVRMRENMLLEYCDKPYYEDNQGVKIETIPNLAKIKAIWKVSRENRDVFTMKHRLPPHYKSARNLYVICDEYSGTYTTKENEIYEALAVEYKPKESEKVMSEKVKLPKFMCEWLSDIALMEDYPLGAILESEKLRYGNREVLMWSTGNTANQWKLIDALRYGYEAEPEPRWGIKAGNCYMDNKIRWQFDRVTPDFIIDDELAYFTDKNKADDMVKTLGFGEVVDLNKEVNADD